MNVYEVAFEVYSRLPANSKEDAIKKFMDENNVPVELQIYITAEDVTLEEMGM